MGSKSAKKKAREEAAAREIARRRSSRSQASPLTRSQLEALIEYISEETVTAGKDWKSFQLTRDWLRAQSLEEAAILSFFESQRVKDDFSVLVSADPNDLFGPTETRLARMPLDRPDLEGLIDFLDDVVAANGCDHTTRNAKDWLAQHRQPLASTLTALLAQGGGCDCEIVVNVEPDAIYP